MKKTLAFVFILALSSIFFVASCSANNDKEPVSEEDATVVHITFTNDEAQTPSRVYDLDCRDQKPVVPGVPTTGNACAMLEQKGAQGLMQERPQEVCTEIYGGPETMQITGKIAGEPVTKTFTRTNGCRIQEWDAFVPVFDAALKITFKDATT